MDPSRKRTTLANDLYQRFAWRFLTIGSSDRGARLRGPRSKVDDWDKVPSFDAGEAPRRSTSSLEAVLDTGIALVYRICYEQFGGQRFS